MKTKIEILVLLVLFLLSSYLIYTFVGTSEESLNVLEVATIDEKAFKKEFESLNGILDIENRTYPNVNITKQEYNGNTTTHVTDGFINQFFEKSLKLRFVA